MEPKFKVGDLIQNVNVYKVLAITPTNYVIQSSRYGTEYLFRIECVESNYKLVPKEVKITREDLAEAWDAVTRTQLYAPSKDSRLFKTLVDKLGL